MFLIFLISKQSLTMFVDCLCGVVLHEFSCTHVIEVKAIVIVVMEIVVVVVVIVVRRMLLANIARRLDLETTTFSF